MLEINEWENHALEAQFLGKKWHKKEPYSELIWFSVDPLPNKDAKPLHHILVLSGQEQNRKCKGN